MGLGGPTRKVQKSQLSPCVGTAAGRGLSWGSLGRSNRCSKSIINEIIQTNERSAMPKLIVDKLKCIVESDEIGSDDVYLVVFVGRKATPLDCELFVVGPGHF